MAGIPNFDGAARGNDHLDHALRNFHDRLERLERGQQLQGVDSDKQAKVSPPPPRAKFVLVPESARFSVRVSNPEFLLKKGGNPLRTPIYHRLQYSADPAFRSGVIELPPSTQTNWTIAATKGKRMHVRLLSSYDGHTWNLPVQNVVVPT